MFRPSDFVSYSRRTFASLALDRGRRCLDGLCGRSAVAAVSVCDAGTDRRPFSPHRPTSRRRHSNCRRASSGRSSTTRRAKRPGTIIIDTPNTYLYYVLGNGQAIRYGIGVGRDGFTWSGVQTITKKAEWPDWTPPPEMIARQPYLPRQMAGGPGNPLGARAMYLGGTIYRIHGTNAPQTIGTHVSSGCIRLTNQDVSDLYSRASVGTKVIVLPMDRRADLAH